MKRLQRRTVHAVTLLLVTSGLSWTVLRGGLGWEGIDSAPRELATLALKVHGAAAMTALFLLGTVEDRHVVQGWRSGRNWVSGAAMVGAQTILVVTAYLLYYAGESARNLASDSHLIIGLLSVPLLSWHVVAAWRRRVAARVRPHATPRVIELGRKAAE